MSQLASLRGLAQTPGQASSSRKVVVSSPTSSLDDFHRLVETCAELGITHVDISDLPKARWQWFDVKDPWPNWSMLNASFFKIAPPKAMNPWIPAEYGARCQEVLGKRGDILRQYKLKAIFNGAEPMWLPEGIYAEHPEWRGPRCQWPPRANHNYYCPCIDRPEVLAMYRQSVAEICRLAPIEEFNFFSNDSGAGICWHPGLYPGVNGPEFCKDRPMAERLDGWMHAVQAGAKDAGFSADVTIAGRSTTPDAKPRTVANAGPGNYLYFSGAYPVRGIPQPVTFAEELEAAFADPSVEWRFNVDYDSAPVLFDLVREFRKQPATTVVTRVETLNRVAAHQSSAASADALMRAWECIQRAMDTVAPINQGGPLLLLGTLNQRWLVRPLVPFPLELSAEEKSYYRRFQMQAWSEETAANLMSEQGNYMIHGPASTWLASRMLDDVMDDLSAARAALKQAIASATPGNRDGLEALDLRVYAMLLAFRNAKHAAQYQEFLDRMHETPDSRQDTEWGRPLPAEGTKLAKAEMENTKELIALLQSTKVPLFAMAPTAAEEDVFLFGPDLVAQLQKKLAIMDSHLPEHIRF